MRRGILFLVVWIIQIQFISGLSVEIKEAYEQKETAIIKISGEIKEPLINEQIEILRGHVKVPVEYGVVKIERDYYIWMITPSNPNNYTLKIKEVITTLNGQNVKIDHYSNFSVINKLTDYTIRPGAIFTKEDFEIEIILHEDINKKISINFPENKEIEINPGTNKISFPIDDIEGIKVVQVSIGKYKFPAYIIGKPIVQEEKKGRVRTIPEAIYRSVEYIPRYEIEVYNTGEINEEITVEYNSSLINLEPKYRQVVPSNRSVFYNISFKEGTSNIKDKIVVHYSNGFIIIPLEINVSNTKSTNATNVTALYRCSEEAAGKVCSADEVCSGKTKNTVEGVCCLSKCIKKNSDPTQNNGGSGQWIGYTIAGVIGIVIIYVFMKYRKTRGNTDSLNVK